MGDIADWMIDQALDRGEYFSRYSKGSARARMQAGRYSAPANPPPTCNKCGKADMKWKWSMERHAWALYEIDAHHAATAAEHQCAAPADCSDLV